ncbi:MAG TPA: DEAD/DEAH box helicase, partial [Thermoplasmata archaeon]|nr:DEAD/DEAH box helicase [Thermoplasmata archaeon]
LTFLGDHDLREPTEIQRRAIPVLLGDADALLVSPTGTGKTEAALLPLLSRLLARPSPGISILYVTPLRALNRDLEQRLIRLGNALGLRVAVRHGDTTAGDRLKQSKRPPDVLLTTPETLQILLVGKRLKEGLRQVQTVVVDELHELAPSDRGAQLALTLERLDDHVGRRIRRIGLSATVGNPSEVARFLSPEPRQVEVVAAAVVRSMTIRVDAAPEHPAAPDEKRRAEELRADHRLLRALEQVVADVRTHTTTLLFVNTRPTAEGLAARLARLAPDLPVAVHHGSLSREIREEAERQFREGQLRCLVSTSSLELGIDVGAVDLVIQFGSPHQASRLVQRVGRSGHRFDRTAEGIVLALDDDDLEESAVLARRAMAGALEATAWRRRNRLAVAQQVVATLRADGAVDAATVAARFRRAAPAQDLSERDWTELVEYLQGLGTVRSEGPRIVPGRRTLDRFYATLSLIPEERTYKLRDLASRRIIGTLDERFVLTQVIGRPEQIFLLHGRTWRVVEFRDNELLVEGVAELGVEPRWVGEDLPVPFEVAQEIGALRRLGDLDRYPLSGALRERLRSRTERGGPTGPTDERVTVTITGRLAIFGACFGTRTNETLATAVAGLLAARLGGRVEVASVEPTWIVLNLPIAVGPDVLRQSVAIDPATLDDLLRRLVPATLEFRWVFLTVARKLGVLPESADPRDLRILEPLLGSASGTPLGEETLEKTLHDRFDVPHATLVLEGIRDGRITVEPLATGPWTDGVLERLRWTELPDRPPPTLLKAVEERLGAEELVLVCLRCGYRRSVTPARYTAEGGSVCRLCKGSLSAVVSPRRTAEIEQLVKYAKRKWKGKGPARVVASTLPPLVRQGYTSAELLATHGVR